MGIFSMVGGVDSMASVKKNYDSANTYVKKVEQSVNETKASVRENKSNSLFNISSDLKEKNTVLDKKYKVSGDAATKGILEDWTAIIELRKTVRTDNVAIDNEAKKIEEEFRRLSGL